MRRKSFYGGMVLVYMAAVAVMIGFAYFVSDSVTTLSENSVVYDRKVIVIDAGHGGVDGGATSCSGVLESKTNLEIALKLRDVCHLLGIKTVMIRTEDISVYTSGDSIAAKKVSDLKERVRIVNENTDCILISIHQNFFTDSQYSGAQVFYNSMDSSKELASIMQNTFVKTLNPGSNRRSKKADGVYLMQNIRTTGILIECGFISNQNEDALLQTNEYQQKLCAVIGSVISLYLNT